MKVGNFYNLEEMSTFPMSFDAQMSHFSSKAIINDCEMIGDDIDLGLKK
jgi:hypothetical protein